MRVALFTLTAFLSAALLFLVQPMAAKMALPVLGGSSSVWTTSMLFFQAGLLAGYAWAHLLSSRLPARAQVGVHLGLLALAAISLPPALGAAGLPPVDASPVPWLLLALGAGFGLPYVAVAATGPLIQSWLASTDDPRAADPYFLYAASNLGSFAGLLLYPFLVEPSLPVRALGAAGSAGGPSQAAAWAAGYGALAVAMAACAAFVFGRRVRVRAAERGEAPTWRRRALWAALAAVPSSAALGTTQHLTTDLAAVPLLWVIPLAVYLLTFVVAFSPSVRITPGVTRIVYGALAVATAASFHEPVRTTFELPVLVLPIATLAALGLLLHGRLAALRPDRAHLTDFYLSIAAGGVLGGAFNALVAPSAFTSIAEYPIALAAALFLVPADSDERAPRGIVTGLVDLAAPVAVLGAAVLLGNLVPTSADGARMIGWLRALVPALLALAAVGWTRRFAWSLTALLVATWSATQAPFGALHRDRSFYGVHRVAQVDGPAALATDTTGRETLVAQRLHVLVDGVTRHGSQSMEPDRRRIPTTYYHPSGPLGDVVRAMRLRGPLGDVGIVGLGAGTIAAYGEPGERFVYFEIDPSVAAIAKNPAWFTYLADARAATEVKLGDGRRSLAAAPDGAFDLIVIDAFSSDAIPAHLLTREAFSLYLAKLKPGGCIALHLTNRFLKLEPVVGAIAADLGAPAAILQDATLTPEQVFEGKDLSKWAVVSRPGSTLPVDGMGGWNLFVADPAAFPERYHWTDDRSDILGLLLAR